MALYLEPDNIFTELQAVTLSQPCSAQLAEIKALTATGILGQGKRFNVYSDSY